MGGDAVVIKCYQRDPAGTYRPYHLGHKMTTHKEKHSAHVILLSITKPRENPASSLYSHSSFFLKLVYLKERWRERGREMDIFHSLNHSPNGSKQRRSGPIRRLELHSGLSCGWWRWWSDQYSDKISLGMAVFFKVSGSMPDLSLCLFFNSLRLCFLGGSTGRVNYLHSCHACGKGRLIPGVLVLP